MGAYDRSRCLDLAAQPTRRAPGTWCASVLCLAVLCISASGCSSPGDTADTVGLADAAPDGVVVEDQVDAVDVAHDATLTKVPNTECASAYPGHTVGLLACSDKASPGYTLVAPVLSSDTFLIDNLGNEVHRWPSENLAGFTGYLLEDGTLLRAGKVAGAPGWFGVLFASGKVDKIAWDGTLLWSYTMAEPDRMMHHDVAPLPNGHVLVLAWELKTRDEAIAAGRDPAKMKTNVLWMDTILELEPVGPNETNVVWQWRLWDHLVQNFDPTKLNYGDPAAHPDRVDFNSGSTTIPEWVHANALSYHAGFDQIMLTMRDASEVVILDHSTTTAEAQGSTGGKRGKGGDLLYRWGNPAMYGTGAAADRRLFGCHDGHWVEPGVQGAGHILVFNNGSSRPGTPYYSSVEEFVPPVDENGDYTSEPGKAFGPTSATWTFKADPPESMYSAHMSSSQRLPNGNMLICDGSTGTLIEVSDAGQVVWKYRNPVSIIGPARQGEKPPPGPTGVGSGLIVFKTRRYPPDYPGLAGKVLTPIAPIEN